MAFGVGWDIEINKSVITISPTNRLDPLAGDRYLL